MQSYRQALRKILKNSFPLKPRWLPLCECLGLALVKDLYSPEDLPGFDNSAVDGYAICGDGRRRFELIGEIAAGGFFLKTLKPGQAARIFTGAAVPRGTRAVVMQENAELLGENKVLLKKGTPRFLENIRFRGEDVRKGTLLVKKGARLEPAHLALLAALGFKHLSVYPAPTVAILATGNELSKKDARPKAGMIRDSNTVLLEALVKKCGAIPVVFGPVGDDPRAIGRFVRQGLKSNLFLIAGGVSVGKYDFVKEVLRREGVRQIFWKVDIKPGKPLFFGLKGRAQVFGLPGNPVSVFVTFGEFVLPAILKQMGIKNDSSFTVEGRLVKGFQNGPRLHFIRARCFKRQGRYVIRPLRGQGSHELGTLAASNAILRVEPNQILKRGEQVEIRIMSDCHFRARQSSVASEKTIF